MTENELNKDKRDRSKESEKDERSFRSESTNLETGTTPKANVNTSSFGGAGTRGESESTGFGGSKPTSGRDFGGQERGGTGGGGGTVPNANTGTQRGSIQGSNVASGTGVRRETESSQHGTSPTQAVQNPKIGGQPGPQSAGGRPDQQRQGFNEGQGGQQGSRRTSERPEGRPEERKKREEQV